MRPVVRSLPSATEILAFPPMLPPLLFWTLPVNEGAEISPALMPIEAFRVIIPPKFKIVSSASPVAVKPLERFSEMIASRPILPPP